MIYKDSGEMVTMLMGAGSIFAALAIVFAATALIWHRRKLRKGKAKGCGLQMLLFLTAGIPFLVLPLAVYAAGGGEKMKIQKDIRMTGETQQGGEESRQIPETASENMSDISETETVAETMTEPEETETKEMVWDEKEMSRILKKANLSFCNAAGIMIDQKEMVLQTGGKADRPEQVKIQVRIRDFDPEKMLAEGTPLALRIEGGQEAWQKEAAGRIKQIDQWRKEKEEWVWEFPFSKDGRYLLQIGFVSDEGVFSACVMADLILDTEKPRVFTDGWQGGSYYSREDCSIPLRVEDANPDRSCLPQTQTEGLSAGFYGWEKSDAGLSGSLILRGEGTAYMSFTARDLAGNVSEIGRQGPVVIDKTPPEMQIFSSDGNLQDGVLYVSSPQKIVIAAKDSSFAPDLGELRIDTAGGDWRADDWRQEEGIWYRSVYLTQDGSYQVRAQGSDLAGNQAEISLQDKIVIDTAAPAIRIEGAEDSYSYRKGVRLKVTGSDDNLSFDTMRIVLLNQLTGQLTESSRKERGDAAAFELEALEDGIYLLQAEVKDAAGNERKEQIRFRVNKSGSRIEPDEDTGSILLSGFMKEASPLVFTERNIDKLQERRLVLSSGGRIRLLKEGADYQVEEREAENGLHSYQYRIQAACFAEEGEYHLHIYTRDAAGNEYTGSRQEALFRFTADYKLPEITVSGLEDGLLYRSGDHFFTISVKDTVAAAALRVYVNGSLILDKQGKEIWEAGGVFSLHLTPSDSLQEIKAEAEDAAGRKTVTQIRDVLIQKPDQPLPKEAEKLPQVKEAAETYAEEAQTQLYRIPELIQDAAGGLQESTDDNIKEILFHAAGASAAMAVLVGGVFLLHRKRREGKGNP